MDEENNEGMSAEELEAMKVVADQVTARFSVVEVPKQLWQRWSTSLQDAVNFALYDLVEPPEQGRRGKVVIAQRRPNR